MERIVIFSAIATALGQCPSIFRSLHVLKHHRNGSHRVGPRSVIIVASSIASAVDNKTYSGLECIINSFDINIIPT